MSGNIENCHLVQPWLLIGTFVYGLFFYSMFIGFLVTFIMSYLLSNVAMHCVTNSSDRSFILLMNEMTVFGNWCIAACFPPHIVLEPDYVTL